MGHRVNTVCCSIVTLITACGEVSQASRSESITDSAGIRIISNARARTDLATSETLRLGVVDGGGPEQFSQILAVALGRDGAVAVGNSASGTVRLFDSTGTFLSEFGGLGRGPTEVSMVNEVYITGDTVLLTDWQRGGRSVFFRTDGSLLNTWTVTRADGSRMQPLALGPSGWLMSVRTRTESRPPTLGPGESWSLAQNIFSVDLESAELGPQIYSIPVYTLYGSAQAEGGADWSLFRPQVSWGFDGKGNLYTTDPRDYRIDVADSTGVVRSIRREYEPRILTQQDIQDLRAAALGVLDTMSRMPPGERVRQKEQLGQRMDRQAQFPIPEVATPLGPILVSDDGSFWVQIRDTTDIAANEANAMFSLFGNISQAPTNWDLFDASGAYIGSVVLPARFRPEAVNGMEVVGVWLDDLDVEYVRKLGVSR